MKKPVIFDGDMGGDDIWAVAIMLAHPDKFDIRGISTCFGNVSQPKATENISDMLHLLGRDDIEVVEGANSPIDGLRPFGDDAYGEDGLGGVILQKSPIHRIKPYIADWYKEKLEGIAGKTTILCTGPSTNLALALLKYPELSEKIEEIVFMGGGLTPPGKDGKSVVLDTGEIRSGNITPYAEFNAYQDPAALNIVLQSGAPVTIMSADASQYMVLTEDREKQIQDLHEKFGELFLRMLVVVKDLDQSKFGVEGAFIHDPNVVVYALRPDLYVTKPLKGLCFLEETPDNPRRGQTVIRESFASAVNWVHGITDDKEIFEVIKSGLAETIRRAPEYPAHLAI